MRAHHEFSDTRETPPTNSDTAVPSGSYTINTTIRSGNMGFNVNNVPGRSAIQIHMEGTTTGCIVFDRDTESRNWEQFKCDMQDTSSAGQPTIRLHIRYDMSDGSDNPRGNRGDGRADEGGPDEVPWPDIAGL